jgi:hypothetical protein
MTSQFDTDVRLRREHTPWARVNVIAFMRDMALQLAPGAAERQEEVVLRVHHRPDVASRFWWSLEWTGPDGERHDAQAQEFDLLLWRAVEGELRLEQRARLEREAAKANEFQGNA